MPAAAAAIADWAAAHKVLLVSSTIKCSFLAVVSCRGSNRVGCGRWGISSCSLSHHYEMGAGGKEVWLIEYAGHKPNQRQVTGQQDYSALLFHAFVLFCFLVVVVEGVVMILPQVHLRKPCYDFTFL